MRPQVGAEAVGGQRQIVIEADAEPALARMFLGRPQLAIQLPLQILVKQNAAAVFAGECLRRGGFRILVWLRPRSPVPHVRVFRVNRLVQRGMQSETVQQIAFALDVPRKLPGPRSLSIPIRLYKCSKQQLQEAQLQFVHALVFHELGGAQAADLSLSGRQGQQCGGSRRCREILHLFDVQINWIAIEDRVRQVRAGVVRLPVGDRVQRVERDEARAGLFRHPVQHGPEIGGIAASPIAVGADTVEADGESRGAARFQPLRLISPRGANDEARRRPGFTRDL